MTTLGAKLLHPANLPRVSVTALLVIFVLLFPVTRPEDPDVWFHLSVGRFIWTGGGYPGMELFLFSYPEGGPSYHHAWLFQSLIYPLYQSLGMKGLVAAKSLLIAASFLLLFFSSQRQRTFYPLLAYFLVAYASGSGRFYLRPEISGGLILAVMWSVLSRPLCLRGGLAIIGLQVLWTNVHWSSILGPAVVGAFAAADLAGRLLPLPRGWTTGARGSHWSSYPLLMIFILLATLLNPDGIRPFIEPFRYIGGGEFLLPVAELWPTHRALFRQGGPSFQLWYFTALALGILSFIANPKRICLAHLLVFVGLGILSLLVERHVLFFSLLALPIVGGNLAALIARRPAPAPSLTWRGISASLVAGFVLVTLLMNKITGVSFVLPYPKPYEPFSAGDSAFLWPHRAASVLLESRLPERIFNNFNSGNYLNWAIFPRRVYINGTFAHRETEEQYARLRKDPGQWDDFAEKMGIETVFFRLVPLITPSRLIRTVVRHPGWKLVFYDGTAAILVRDTTGNRAITEAYSVDLEGELQGAVRSILTDGGNLPGKKIPFWREVEQYRRARDLSRHFRLRGRFYLLAGRPDLAAIAVEMVKNLEG